MCLRSELLDIDSLDDRTQARARAQEVETLQEVFLFEAMSVFEPVGTVVEPDSVR